MPGVHVDFLLELWAGKGIDVFKKGFYNIMPNDHFGWGEVVFLEQNFCRISELKVDLINFDPDSRNYFRMAGPPWHPL